ncbi:MAG: riboflavin biosynthesis protein RibF, partial [Firmicutes bacterium]|nr:riboflavin biosynthesis protein RibF [Bacillota bacterium]
GAEPAVLSFDKHPDTLVRREPIPLINSAAERVDLIERLFGIRQVLFIHFSEETMRTPWREFLDLTVSELCACHLVVGHDFRFGYLGEGTAELLRAYCRENGLGCDVIDKVYCDGVPVSSTLIRTFLRNGDMERANRFLGHPYILLDTVQYGYRLGRRIGAPTINMRFPEGVLVPSHGVYATQVQLPDSLRRAVTNIGVRPTVGGGDGVTAESFILDYDGELYGKRARVDFYRFLRPERKFESLAALKEQIALDAAATQAYFGA